MKYGELKDMHTTAIVTTPMGSWKYQQAYRFTTYCPRATEDGRIVWGFGYTSGKWSWPQIVRAGYDGTPMGSKINKPVLRSEALKVMGSSRVRSLEARGFTFGKEEE